MDKNPCASCPYRTDTPSGVWSAHEYQKLTEYDDDSLEPAFSVFLCHHSTVRDVETVCRGWLSVAADSVAVRVAVLRGEITPKQRDAPVTVPLYATGAEAAHAGMVDVEAPGLAAIEMVERLKTKGLGNNELEVW